MTRYSPAFGLVALGLLTLHGGCGSSPSEAPAAAPAAPAATSTRPTIVVDSKPDPPFPLPPPPEPSAMYEGTDLRKVPARQLYELAQQLYQQKGYRQAIPLLHHAIQGGAHGDYDLACDYALVGEVDAAFYWLQKAALGEGVDEKWANSDTDLERLRKDARWQKVSAFLAACNTYWKDSGRHTATLVVPKGYMPGTPIGVLVGMHGMGSDPEEFVSGDFFQGIADQLQMAVVGVSGTEPRGERKFVWSEDVARDAAQVHRALAELEGKLTVAPGKLVAFGFSQGAQMAFEVAFANPSEYQGAVVLSPGTMKDVTLRELRPDAANQKQRFVCTCGALEGTSNVRNTRSDADFARKAGSRVELKLYEGIKDHAFPADFPDAFPRWVRFVRGDGQ